MTGRMANHKHSCFLTAVCSQSLFYFSAFWSMSLLSLVKGLFLCPLCCHSAFQSLLWPSAPVKAGAEENLVNECFCLWSASLPPLSFSLYFGIYWRIFLPLFYLLVLQHIPLDLLIISWSCRVQTDNLIPCPRLQEERGLWGSLNTVAPLGNAGAADQTLPQKEFAFSFLLHSSYISISQLNLFHLFYTLQSKQIFQFKWF